MRENEKITFPMTAKNQLQAYADNVTKRGELMDRILRGVRDGNEYQALQALQEKTELGIPGRLNDELEEWKFELIQMMALMLQELRRAGVPGRMLDDAHTEFILRIYELPGPEQCRTLAKEIVSRFCGMNRLRSVREYSPLVQKIILEADMDLGQTLTLQYFSEKLSVNRSYLSNLFRKEVGMTLTEYVTDRRIRTAADLLVMTQQPIKTVAKQVGITDVHYFSRVFKRKMGKPPSQYRENGG